MPTDLPQKRQPASRTEHDDMIIARGQIEIVDLISARFSRVVAWLQTVGRP